jgi:hypothetical protein
MNHGAPISIYLASDIADAMREAGCRMRTPAAVRSAIKDGRLRPDLLTPRGVQAWTEDALRRDVAAQYRRDRLIAACGRQVLTEPVHTQLQLGA